VREGREVERRWQVAADEAVGVHGAERARSRAVVGNWDLPEVEAEEKRWGRCGGVGSESGKRTPKTYFKKYATRLDRRILCGRRLEAFAFCAMLNSNSKSLTKYH
jgi:hypothetical protein